MDYDNWTPDLKDGEDYIREKEEDGKCVACEKFASASLLYKYKGFCSDKCKFQFA